MARISLYHITFNIYSHLFYVFLLSKKSRKTGSSLFRFSLNFYKDKHRNADQTTHQSANIIKRGRGKDIFILPLPVFLFFCKLSYSLLFRKFTYKQHIVFLCHNEIIEPLYNNFLFLCRMDYTIMRII